MKGQYLFLSGLALAALSSNAQILQADYIKWPTSAQLHTYVNNWTPGQELFEDENFFISRVKIKPYFRNTATQVDENLNENNDKRLVFWVPVTYSSWKGVHVDALPNGEFDSEVFSLWPYVTHFGDWTSPYGWVPGNFADAAHKHGTAVSGLASVPNASLSGDWYTCMAGMGSVNAEKAGKFLWYHGVDGLGYNSEWFGSKSIIDGLNRLHDGVYNFMKDRNPKHENIWYTGTEDSGSVNGFYDALHSGNKGLFGTSEQPRTSLFLNYNWHNETKIRSSETTAAELGRSMKDLYAGENMQNHSVTATGWQRHLTCGYSIGLWGAHSQNYLWEGRNSNGSAPKLIQATYQKRLEQWFQNGKRNPIAKQEVIATQALKPSDNWFGMSRFMTARSSLSWDLTEEPFVSYFNLGNGLYFNYKGERQHDNTWYNIGIQDYMPTWRFWQSNEFLGKEPSNIVENGLNVAFSWDEAYMGGSSLRFEGSVENEYVHLFKTSFQLETSDVITVRYKLTSGTADVSLALSIEGAENTTVRESNLSLLKTTDDVDDDVWVEKTFRLTQALGSALKKAPLAMIALHFENADNINFYLGEISITRGNYPTPAAPIIDRSKILANNFSGIDGKIIFHMANSKEAGEPVYNLDVNTSLFRLYFQQEGGEPVNMGATTSWAGIVFAAPYNTKGTKRVRFGVSAVNLDFSNESEISWGEWLDSSNYTINEDVVIDKSTIKPDETFEVKFADGEHAAVNWDILDSSNKSVFTSNATTGFECSLKEIGAYDVVINKGTATERRLNSFIQVSGWEKGALPRIQSLSINSENTESVNGVTIEPNTEAEFAYTGRSADGHGSRGIQLGEQMFGVNCGEIGLESNHSFSIAAWVRLGQLTDGIYSFLTIEDRSGSWPKNNWGFFWCRINKDGYINSELIDSAFGGSLDSGADGARLYCDFHNSRIIPGAWTHVCFVFEYNASNQIRYALYLNGVKQTMAAWESGSKSRRESAISNAKTDWTDFSLSWGQTGSGKNTTESGFASTSYPVRNSDWITFGGTSLNINAMDAVMDNFVIWNKAVTDAEVIATMNGLDAKNLPDDVLGFWDLDTDADEDFLFPNKAKNGKGSVSRFERTPGEKEGQYYNKPAVPLYTAGSPFLDVETYAIETKPTWTYGKGTLVSAEGTDTEGKAVITFNKKRDYNVSLTLENPLGSHTLDYPVLTVSDPQVAIEGLETGNLEVYAADKTILLDFAEAGEYTVNVYNIAGELMNGRTMSVDANQTATVKMANAAVYIVNIVRDGKTVRNAKVVVR